MPATRHSFGKCGHKGFGAECHRCAEADRMESLSGAKAKALGPQMGKRKDRVGSFKGWKKEQFLVEAARLRAPHTKSSVFTPSPSDLG